MTKKLTFIILFSVLVNNFSFGGNKEKLLREPYLQTVWADSASIMWKTSIDAKNTTLYFGESLKKISKTENLKQKEHYNSWISTAVIKNLKPNVKYYYLIKINDEIVASGDTYYFITAPKNKRSFSFYAMGDIGAEVGNQEGRYSEQSANQINILPNRPDFGLGLGDIVYPKGESEVYDKNFFEPLSPILKNIPFYPCLGNHDWLTEPDDNFEIEWNLPGNEHFYGFEYANAYFIALDSRNGNFYDINNQTTWLKQELEKIKGKYDWVIVFLHHNGKTCTYKPDYEHVIKMYDVFANNGVDLVLNGHAHTYERLKPYDKNGNVLPNINNHKVYEKIDNGFISITSGAGGKLNKKWAPDLTDIKQCEDSNMVACYGHYPHFSLIEIDGKKLNLKAINSLNGEIFDSFSIEKK